MNAGALDRRAAFERRDTTADTYGNVTSGGWTALTTVWAGLRLERGRERVEAGRVESAVAGTLTVRSSSETRGITPADRVTIDGEVYAIKAIMDFTRRDGSIEMTVESGGAG